MVGYTIYVVTQVITGSVRLRCPSEVPVQLRADGWTINGKGITTDETASPNSELAQGLAAPKAVRQRGEVGADRELLAPRPVLNVVRTSFPGIG